MKPLRFFGVVVLFLELIGCSPGMFFGGSTDEAVIHLPNYRRINTACAGMDLSTSTLSTATFRSLLQCLNANGALDPVDRLINGPQGLSDEELQPLVSVLNRLILNDKKRLYQIDHTYKALDDAGIVDDSFKQMGRLLENQAFLSHSISLLKTGFFSQSRNDILKMIQQVSTKLTHPTWESTLDISLTLGSSKAFRSLVEKFKSNQNRDPHILRGIISSLYQYMSENHTYRCNGNPTEIKRDFIKTVKNGEFFTTLDNILGKTPAEIKTKIPKLVSTLGALLAKDPRIENQKVIENLSFAFQELNHEVECMKGSNKIPNGAMHLFRELVLLSSTQSPTEYFLKDLPITLSTVNPFCSFPTNLSTYYPTLTQLARVGAMDPLTEILKTFYQVESPWEGCDGKGESKGQYHPLAQLVINFLGDEQNSFQKLVPILNELHERRIWDDLFLLITTPEEEDQKKLQDMIRFFVDPQNDLDHKSILDVALQSITTKDYLPLYHWITSLQSYVDSKDDLLVPAITTLRKAYYVNNVHPFLDIIQDLAAEAPQNESLYRTLFLIADRAEFADSIALLSDMAKDGRLKELVECLIRLFHPFIEQTSQSEPRIQSGVAPTFAPKVRHSFSNQDIQSYPLNNSKAQPIPLECDQIDLNFSITQTTDHRFSSQIHNLLQCQSGGNANSELSKAIRFLENSPTETGSSYLQFLIDRANQFVQNPDGLGNSLSSSEVDILFKAWTKSLDDGRFYRLLDAFHLWINGGTNGEITGTSPSTANPTPAVSPSPSPGASVLTQSEPAFQLLLEISNALMTHTRTDLKELTNYVAKIIKREDFPKLLGDLDDVLSYTIPTQSAATSPSDRIFTDSLKERIEKWIENKECTTLPQDSKGRKEQIKKRVDEIIQEARFNMTNWDLVEGKSKTKVPRQSWDLIGTNRGTHGENDGLKATLTPVLQKLADKKISASLFRFLTYFTLSDNDPQPTPQRHYRPDRLLKWLYERSIDFRPITYIYPGETTPRVRLINTLDALELTLVNVDFDAPAPILRNLGLEHLAELGEAWGDIKDPKLWPPEIQKKYQDPKNRPMTLAQAVEDITNRQSETGFDNLNMMTDLYVGLPNRPSCFKDIPGEKPDRQAICHNNIPGEALEQQCGAYQFMELDQVIDFQVRLYNISQVVQTLKDNTPGSGVGFNGGLELLRDLCFEVNSTTAEIDRDPSAADKNNLTFLLKMIRLGVFRQIGRLLIEFEPNDPVLNDFFTTLIHASESSHLNEALLTALNSGKDYELVWQILQAIFDIIDSGTPEQNKNLKQLGLYLLASFNKIEKWQPKHRTSEETSKDLINLLFMRLNEILTNESEFFRDPKNRDFFKDLLKSKNAVSIFRGIYEKSNPEMSQRLNSLLTDFLTDQTLESNRIQNGVKIFKTIYGDPKVKNTWNTFLTQIDELTLSGPYKALQVDTATRPIFNFLEQRTENLTASDTALSQKTLLFLAQLLEKGDLEQLLLLSKADPESFYQALQTAGKYMGDTDQKGLRDLLKMVRRSLSEPEHLF